MSNFGVASTKIKYFVLSAVSIFYCTVNQSISMLFFKGVTRGSDFFLNFTMLNKRFTINSIFTQRLLINLLTCTCITKYTFQNARIEHRTYRRECGERWSIPHSVRGSSCSHNRPGSSSPGTGANCFVPEMARSIHLSYYLLWYHFGSSCEFQADGIVFSYDHELVFVGVIQLIKLSRQKQNIL